MTPPMTEGRRMAWFGYIVIWVAAAYVGWLIVRGGAMKDRGNG